MNERIRELEMQADEWSKYNYTWTPTGNNWVEVYMEKFAELIVQKCISQIALIGISNFENEDIMWTVETAISSIEEHFGVK